MATECDQCGIAASDLPHEDMGMDIEEFADVFFESRDGLTLCQGCANSARLVPPGVSDG
jgi:hypothetical protein